MTKQVVFYKGGLLRFVGHLDMMRTIHRSLSRAGVPIAYSQGFNPHPIMSFANPLGLGLTGENEIMELRLEAPMASPIMMEQLNRELPEGLQVKAVRDIPDQSPAIMSLVEAAVYRIDFVEDGTDFAGAFGKLLEEKEIRITKVGKVKGRKQMVEVDVKPWIYEVSVLSPTSLRITCACGSSQNLKIELLIQKFYDFLGRPELAHMEKIAREALLSGPDSGFINYSDYHSWEEEHAE